MSKILSIGTALPAYCHKQMDIHHFMQNVYALPEEDRRKMRFMYSQSGIDQRYSVIPDYGRDISEWKFYPQSESLEPFPNIDQRMRVYSKQAPLLSVDAIRDCLGKDYDTASITHLITVSCTGMSAPGLDLQLVELMEFNKNIFRTSINFMGCYAAIHGMKLAHALCSSEKDARVLVVCTELCTLHFQREATMDNIASSLLFGDGSAAVLICSDDVAGEGLSIGSFYSEVIAKGKRDMAWEISSSGFLMTLSGYIPQLIESNFREVMNRAMAKGGSSIEDINNWCIHPGGKKILRSISDSIGLDEAALRHSYSTLQEYGNLSSATILFVLKKIMEEGKSGVVAGAAFGPGLTVETFTAVA